jgi:hypothetical protein
MAEQQEGPFMTEEQMGQWFTDLLMEGQDQFAIPGEDNQQYANEALRQSPGNFIMTDEEIERLINHPDFEAFLAADEANWGQAPPATAAFGMPDAGWTPNFGNSLQPSIPGPDAATRGQGPPATAAFGMPDAGWTPNFGNSFQPSIPGPDAATREQAPPALAAIGTPDAGWTPNSGNSVQVSTPGTDAASNAGLYNIIKPTYQGHLHNFQAARQVLANVDNPSDYVLLGIADDDSFQVKVHEVGHYAARLFEALTTDVVAPPETFSNFQKAYFRDHQGATMNSIFRMLNDEPVKSEGRVLLVIEQVIELHKTGIPRSVLERINVNNHSYKFETGMKCSERLERIITVAKQDKYVAYDILFDRNIPDLVRSPSAYAKRKVDNCRMNGRKAEMISARRHSDQGETTPVAPKKMKVNGDDHVSDGADSEVSGGTDDASHYSVKIESDEDAEHELVTDSEVSEEIVEDSAEDDLDIDSEVSEETVEDSDSDWRESDGDEADDDHYI